MKSKGYLRCYRYLLVFIFIFLSFSERVYASIVSVDNPYFSYNLINGGLNAELTSYTGDSTNLNIPSMVDGYAVTSIGNYAFANNSTLSEVVIPSGVVNIGGGAFMGDVNLTSVTIPDGVTHIGDSAFANAGVISVEIPSGVSAIGIGVFYNCVNLTSVSIPNTVTSIGNNAFAYTGLTSIDIPSSVISIGNGVFYHCLSLSGLVIPDSVVSPGDNIFSNSSLSNITIPDSVVSIGSGAFYNCANLTSVNLPKHLTSIGTSTFAFSGLESIVIPNGVKAIYSMAFNSAQSLVSVTIPSSITFIGNSAFSNCINLANVYFLGTAPSFSSSVFASDDIIVIHYSSHHSKIRSVPISSIEIFSSSTAILKGDIVQFSVNILPENATHQTVNWSVINNTGEGKIDDSGLFTANTVGDVIIVASSTDNSDVAGTKKISIIDSLDNKKMITTLDSAKTELVATSSVVEENQTVISTNTNSYDKIFTKNLKIKDSNPDVLRLQKFLNSRGFIISESGNGSVGKETDYFGILTKKALIKFQEKNNIPATGYFGQITRDFIKGE